MVLMLWVYYSSQLLLYGAALGRISDEHDSKRHRPALLSPESTVSR
ncbi:MAG: hypothetical protein WAZ34_10755 [Rhodocyclaceae bacterium]